jgi:stage II sporulation protein GA (sporulation sigma-E factor processing peptidase)
MRVVWVDLCFAINFAADYLLCLLAARLCAVPLARRRYALAALLGALWAVAAAAGLSFPASPGGKLLGAAALCVCAFYGRREFRKLCAAFLALSAALGGAVWALALRGDGSVSFSFGLLAFCFALFRALFDVLLRGAAGGREREIVEVELRFLGRAAVFRALVDTGNSLCDPVGGEHVMVVAPAALRSVFGELEPLFSLSEPTELFAAAASLDALRGRLRLIPYSALNARGLLVAFRPDSLTVGGEERRDLLVALSSSASGEGHEALL